MARGLAFLFHFLCAKARLRFFELSPGLYRKFHLALAMPHWRQFPFYAEAPDFFSLPVMSKAQLLENFPRLNKFHASYAECLEAGLAQEKSRNFLEGTEAAFSIGLSSGTSGRRGVFLTTESERVRWVATILAHASFLDLRKPQKVAFFLRSNSPLYERVGGKRIEFRFFDLARGFEELWEELREFRPTALLAPPALLSLVREHDRQEKRVAPRVVVSVADKLERDEKARLEEHFGVRLHEVYQATEGFLGITCRFGNLHLNEDLFFLERHWIDESHTAFEPILSDYFRQSQAFVRFRLDDVLVPRESCPCGSRRQALREIRGRADDVLWFEAGGKKLAVLPDFVRQAIQNHLARDIDFKVVQKRECLEVQLAEEPGTEELSAISQELRGFLEKRGIPAPTLDWSFSLRRGPGEKRKRVERRS